MSTIQVRGVHDPVKQAAQQVFSQMGISMSAAIKMFLHHVAITRVIPFKPTGLTVNGFTPEFEAEVLAALDEPDEGPYYSAEELIADLHKQVN